jgi:dimethylaniline monooxygenase (N-oxide forming)
VRPDPETVAVIGAGLSGLVVGRELRHRGVDYICYEREPEIGGVWRHHPNVVTVTCRDAMGLSSFPMAPDMPDFPSGEQLVRQMNTYADEFSLRDHIRTGTGVADLSHGTSGRWRLTLEDGGVSEHRAVVLATGRIGSPTWPELEGSFNGRLLHAGDRPDPVEFRDQRVVVIGFGNSAVDLACEVSRHAHTTYLAIRTGAWVVPRYFCGRPLDEASGPIVTRIPMALRWPVYKALLYTIQGKMESFGLPKPAEKPGRRPLTVSDELLPRLGAGQITPIAPVTSLCGDELELSDGRRVVADAVVCATGYSVELPLIENSAAGRGLSLDGMWHNMLHPELPNLYVVGAIVAFGAIPPIVEAQARLAANLLSGYGALPTPGEVKRDLAAEQRRRHRYAPGPTRNWMVGETPACLQRLSKATDRATRRAVRGQDDEQLVWPAAIAVAA